MLRSAASRAGVTRSLALSPRQAATGSRGFCSGRGGVGPGRNLPITLWGRGGPWGHFSAFDNIASRMMDRHMRQMERVMDEVMSGGPRAWPRWAADLGGVNGRSSGRGEVEHFKYNEKEFEIKVDVSGFKPEDLEVKVTKDKLTMSGKHREKRDDYGFVSREFTRHFEIPEDVDAESMETILTSEGALIVRAKVKGAETEGRTLNIKTEESKTEPNDK